MNLLLSILSGFLLSLIFPKCNLYWVAWFALVPLFYAVKRSKNASACGYFFGLSFFGVTFAFLITLQEWVGGLILLGWILLTLILSTYTAIFAYLLKKIAPDNGYVFLAPALWVLIEWLRSLGPFGLVPSLGYSQWPVLPLIQITSVTGIAGLSFLIVLGNSTLEEFLTSSKSLQKKLGNLLILGLLLGIVSVYGEYQIRFKPLPTGPELRISAIQGNFPEKEKLTVSNLPLIKQTYLQLTKQSLNFHPGLVIWPETSVPAYVQDDQVFLDELCELAKKNNFSLLLGLPRHDKNFRAYNSAMFISSNGEILGWQDKHQLVPFGEYLPLRPILGPIFKKIKALESTIFVEQDFSSSSFLEPFSTDLGKIGVGICADSFFPGIFRDFDNQNTDYFFIITNDAWYKQSSAVFKHVVADIFLAVEFGRYVVQNANTGISLVIDPRGAILEQTKLDERKILNAKIYKIKDRTLYSRFGEWFTYFILINLLFKIVLKYLSPKITAAKSS